jgi:hypothetical protein
MSKRTYTLEVIGQKIGFQEDDILRFVENSLISPYNFDELLFDEEDLARLRLISNLQEQCEPNEESLEVILHLIDQIHYLKKKIVQAP